jgi:uncharacterized protein YggE
MRTLALFAYFTSMITAATAQAQVAPTPPAPSIVTRGEATIKRAPDQAWVSIAAETRAPTPGEAQRLAAEAMTSVQAALKKAGLPNDAIRTTGYSLQPDMEYQNGRGRVRGYIARNQIEVRVDALDKLGAVLDAAGGSGATSLAGLRFDLKERRDAEREALKLAVEDAMGRARAIASGAGASVGPILRIDEFPREPQPMYREAVAMMDRSAAQAPTPVSPGELEITAQVTLTVAIR